MLAYLVVGKSHLSFYCATQNFRTFLYVNPKSIFQSCWVTPIVGKTGKTLICYHQEFGLLFEGFLIYVTDTLPYWRSFMSQAPVNFQQYPRSVKHGIIFFATGWLTTFLFLYRFFVPTGRDTSDLWRIVVMGVVACFFVFRIRNWARKLCLFLNICIIAYYLLLSYDLYQKGYIEAVVTLLVSAALFALSSYYLIKKETAQFYLLNDPKNSPAAQEDEGNN